VADLLNKISSGFCANFTKVKEAEELTFEGTGFDEALENLKRCTNKNKKLYDQEIALITPLRVVLSSPIPEEPKRLIVRTKKIRVELDDLSAHKLIFGSVFVGAGTAKYWNKMSTHCNNIANDLAAQVQAQEAEKESQQPVLTLKEAQEIYGAFSGCSKSAKKVKELEKQSQFFGDKCKTWKDVFDILPKPLQNKYSGEESEEDYKEFILGDSSSADGDLKIHCSKSIVSELEKRKEVIHKAFKKCQKNLTKKNIDRFITIYTEFKNFIRSYKNQYFYNCLLFRAYSVEFDVFKKLNLAVPKKERNQ
jgi:hypothetical protein